MMNQTATRMILAVLSALAILTSTGNAQNAPGAAGDTDPTSQALIEGREAARIAREKAVAALADADAKLQEGDIQSILKRFPGIVDVYTLRDAYRHEPQLRKALIDVERLERLRDRPETRGNEPPGLDIPALLATRELVLNKLIPRSRYRPPVPKAARAEVVAEVEKFVEELRRNPIKSSSAKDRLAIYLLNIATGEVLLVADEPDPGFTYCGSPEWSVDGKRILFDATPAPGNRFSESRLKALELSDGKLNLTDLGPGNCPTGTPEGSALVFLLNPGAVAGAKAGVWSMKADGTGRDPLCDYGRPCMSSDGKHLIVSSFGEFKEITLLDVDSGDVKPLPFPGYRITSTPFWATPTSIVAMIRSILGDAIALITVDSQTDLSVEYLLWKTDANPRFFASHPSYSEATGRCAFVGLTREGRALYSVMKNSNEPPKRLESGPYDNMLSTLAFSPDGKYLLFCGDRPGEIKKKP